MAKYRNVQMALFRRWDATLAQFSISLLYYKRILFSCCIISNSRKGFVVATSLAPPARAGVVAFQPND